MESSGSSTTPTSAASKSPRRRSSGEQARLVVVAALAVLATAFALLNFHRVRVDFIVTKAHPPLIIVIVACLAVGLVIGMLGGRHQANRRR